MAERGAREAGDAGSFCSFTQYVVESPVVVLCLIMRRAEVSGDKRGALVEGPSEDEMPKHPVNAVDRFVDVFDDENRALEVRRERSAEERGDEREVSADNASFGFSRTNHASIGSHSARIAVIDESRGQRFRGEGS
jgi:hypothetical protein